MPLPLQSLPCVRGGGCPKGRRRGWPEGEQASIPSVSLAADSSPCRKGSLFGCFFSGNTKQNWDLKKSRSKRYDACDELVRPKGLYPRAKKGATGAFFASCGMPPCSSPLVRKTKRKAPSKDGTFLLESMNPFDTALLGRAASAASIRNEVENCHRRNSLPPLNDEMVLRPAPSGRSPIKTPRRMSWRFDWCA